MEIKKMFQALFSLDKSVVETIDKQADPRESYNYKRGLELLDSNDKEAFDFFQKELEEHPANGYAHYQMGGILYNHDILGAALNYVNTAIRYLQNDRVWYSAAFYQRARINKALGNIKDFIQDAQQAIESNPEDCHALTLLAEHYYEVSDFDASDSYFKRIVDMREGDVYGYLGLGRNLVGREMYEEAIEKFEYAMLLDANDSQPYSWRAECHMCKQRFGKALDDAITALSMDANNEKAKYVIHAIAMISDTSLVISKLRLAMNKYPGQSRWLILLANIQEDLGKYVEANQSLTKAFELTGDTYAYMRIAMNQFKLLQFRKAAESADKAISGYPDSAALHLAKAKILIHDCRFTEAIETLNRCIQLGSDQLASCYSQRSFCKMETDDLKGALDDMELAIGSDATNSFYQIGKARILRRMGEVENRSLWQKDFQAVLDKGYSTPQEMAECITCLSQLGQREEALQVLSSIDIAGSRLDDDEKSSMLVKLAADMANVNAMEEAKNLLADALSYSCCSHKMLRYSKGWEAIRLIPEYEEIVANAERGYRERFGQGIADADCQESVGFEVPFTVSGNMYSLQGDVNGLQLRFIFDTGASLVTLSGVEADFMLKNGYLDERDFGSGTNFRTASGQICEGTHVILREVSLGGQTLKNVRATVIRNQNAPLLLGQSLMKRLGDFYVDNKKGVIRFNREG